MSGVSTGQPPRTLPAVEVSTEAAAPHSVHESTICSNYQLLLAQFDEKDQGRGLDHFKQVVAPQPMTYGLVMSSEALRHRRTRDEESGRRVRQAVKWLIDNRDLDEDGKSGWGLPQAWDAFADGTENPPNTPYTITTSIVLEGLLEALALEDFWKPAERDEILTLVKSVQLRWCNELWVEGFGDGFFRYSVRPSDAIFAVNSPAMYLVPMVRLLKQHNEALDPSERSLIEQRTHALAGSIVQTVEPRDGLPYWPYMPGPNKLNRRGANDLLHHAYILWGIEAYRDFASEGAIPWSQEQALKSLHAFWRDDALWRFATADPDVTAAQLNAPPRLWSTGMALAVYSKYGSGASTERIFGELLRQHGPMPVLRLTSADASESPAFYARHAAHALFGLAHAGFGDQVKRAVERQSGRAVEKE